MAKNRYIVIFILLFHTGFSQPVYDSCLACYYLTQVGVKEKGDNCGDEVKQYLSAVGIKSCGYSWCAAFVKWTFDQAGIKTPITGWSWSAMNYGNLVWNERTLLKSPQSGDVFCLWGLTQRRINHTGFFHKKINDKVYETVEGNTNENGSVNGDGVYRKKRSYNQTHSISRWLRN